MFVSLFEKKEGGEGREGRVGRVFTHKRTGVSLELVIHINDSNHANKNINQKIR